MKTKNCGLAKKRSYDKMVQWFFYFNIIEIVRKNVFIVVLTFFFSVQSKTECESTKNWCKGYLSVN